MSKFTKEIVDSYANKLLFNLTEEENQMVLDEFEVIDKDGKVLETITTNENGEAYTSKYAIRDYQKLYLH